MSRVLVLTHQDLVPPHEFSKSLQKRSKKTNSPRVTDQVAENMPWRTEYFVAKALRQLGHVVEFLGVSDELGSLRERLKVFRPDVVFNLMEEFSGEALLDYFVLSFLERERIPFTGSRPEALILTRNKMATKKILEASDVDVPGDSYPKIVKCVSEDSSFGLSRKSIVENLAQEKLAKAALRRQLLAKGYRSQILTEAFIPGREIHVGILRGEALAPVETRTRRQNPNFFISRRVKWDFSWRQRAGVTLEVAEIQSKFEKNLIQRAALRAAQAMGATESARVDLRVDLEGNPYVIEVNANPDLSKYDEYALGASESGYSYHQLVLSILETAGARG